MLRNSSKLAANVMCSVVFAAAFVACAREVVPSNEDAHPDGDAEGTPVACATNTAARSWDVAADYSDTSNPCGVWSYGYTPGLGDARFIVYPVIEPQPPGLRVWYDPSDNVALTPSVWKNPHPMTVYGVMPAQVTENAGAHGEYSVLRFTAPAAGTYAIDVRFFAGDQGDTDGAVLRGATVLFAHDTNSDPRYSTTLVLSAGDTVDAAVGPNPDWAGGNTPVAFTVTRM